MIVRVSANQPTFREVSFEKGLNVIIADRTLESTKKDSRNGLGKTTLVEIIHYCLGSSGKPLKVPQLRDWSFSLDLKLAGKPIQVTRSIIAPKFVEVQGDTAAWPLQPEARDGKAVLSTVAWNRILGTTMFGLPWTDTKQTYVPSFRSLISYFARRTRDAFSTPFEHFRKQQDWDKQVNNAYLLDLSWETAREFKHLKERENLLKTLKAAAKKGLIAGAVGTMGELDAERVRLQQKLGLQTENLRTFRVLPMYAEIEQEANALTATLHALANQSLSDKRLLAFYQQSLASEDAPESDEVLRLYDSAKIELPEIIKRRLSDVQAFHRSIVTNRRGFLEDEIGRLQDAISNQQAQIAEADGRRQRLLETLRSHGALEEHEALQRRALETEAQLNDVRTRMSNLKSFEDGTSSLRVEREDTRRKARRENEERQAQRERAITLFNENSEALYEVPGKLVIDIGPNGFQFGVDIERTGSQGIESMKVFCFDLMLAQLWSLHAESPGFLLHDSAIFDGVDERQVALALERAHEKAEECGFQYICSLNSDAVPRKDLSPSFDMETFVRLRLTDATPEGCLLGMRF